jgi:hypothetical protein
VGWWLSPPEGAEVEQCDERAGQHCGAVCVRVRVCAVMSGAGRKVRAVMV